METFLTKVFVTVYCITRYTSWSSSGDSIVFGQNDLTEINWFNASKECQEKGLELEHDDLTLNSLEKLGYNEFWIGIIQYKKLTTWIVPVGCFSFSNVSEKTIWHSIGYCQQNCQSSPFFGYKKSTKECRCLSECECSRRHETKMSNCTSKSSINSMMIYKQFDNNISVVGDTKCLVSACRSNGVQLFPMPCTEKTSNIHAVCDDGTDVRYWISYTEAREECIKRNTTLISPKKCAKPDNVFAWTSAFRAEITVDSFREKSGNVIPLGCLSGKRRNDSKSIDLDINRRCCNETLNFFVCKSNLNKESTTLPPVDQHHTNAIPDTQLNIGALLGGVIGGIITLVLAALLLIWIRRRNNQTAKSNGSESNSNQHESSTVNRASDMKYDLVEDIIVSVPEYAVVKKENKLEKKPKPKYAVVEKENKLSISGDTYALAPEEEYDKLNNVFSRKISHEQNVYGITGMSGEGEYDTIKGKTASNVNSSDNLYDTNVSICGENDY